MKQTVTFIQSTVGVNTVTNTAFSGGTVFNVVRIGNSGQTGKQVQVSASIDTLAPFSFFITERDGYSEVFEIQGLEYINDKNTLVLGSLNAYQTCVQNGNVPVISGILNRGHFFPPIDNTFDNIPDIFDGGSSDTIVQGSWADATNATSQIQSAIDGFVGGVSNCVYVLKISPLGVQFLESAGVWSTQSMSVAPNTVVDKGTEPFFQPIATPTVQIGGDPTPWFQCVFTNFNFLQRFVANVMSLMLKRTVDPNVSPLDGSDITDTVEQVVLLTDFAGDPQNWSSSQGVDVLTMTNKHIIDALNAIPETPPTEPNPFEDTKVSSYAVFQPSYILGVSLVPQVMTLRSEGNISGISAPVSCSFPNASALAQVSTGALNNRGALYPSRWYQLVSPQTGEYLSVIPQKHFLTGYNCTFTLRFLGGDLPMLQVAISSSGVTTNEWMTIFKYPSMGIATNDWQSRINEFQVQVNTFMKTTLNSYNATNSIISAKGWQNTANRMSNLVVNGAEIGLGLANLEQGGMGTAIVGATRAVENIVNTAMQPVNNWFERQMLDTQTQTDYGNGLLSMGSQPVSGTESLISGSNHSSIFLSGGYPNFMVMGWSGSTISGYNDFVRLYGQPVRKQASTSTSSLSPNYSLQTGTNGTYWQFASCYCTNVPLRFRDDIIRLFTSGVWRV